MNEISFESDPAISLGDQTYFQYWASHYGVDVQNAEDVSALLDTIWGLVPGHILRFRAHEEIRIARTWLVPHEKIPWCENNATLRYMGTVDEPAIVLGSPSIRPAFTDASLRVVRNTRASWDDTTNVGILIHNPHRPRLFLSAEQFTVGIHLRAALGSGYRVGEGIRLGPMIDNRYGLLVESVDEGWFNSHLIAAGLFAISSETHPTKDAFGIWFRASGSVSSTLNDITIRDFTFQCGDQNKIHGAVRRIPFKFTGTAQNIRAQSFRSETANNPCLAVIDGAANSCAFEVLHSPDFASLYIDQRGDFGDNIIERFGRTSERPAQGLFWSSGDLPAKATISQDPDTGYLAASIPGMALRETATGTPHVVLRTSTGFAIQNGYLTLGGSTTIGVGVDLSTRYEKQFRLSKEADRTVNAGGRWAALCRDADGNIIGGQNPVPSGSFTQITENAGRCSLTAAGHAVLTGEVLRITGTGLYWVDYNPDADFLPVSSTGIASGGNMVVTVPTPHQLIVGDWVELFGMENTVHGKYRVETVPTTTTFTLSRTGISGTGGYYRPRIVHRVVSTGADTIVTNRNFVGNGAGSYISAPLLLGGAGRTWLPLGSGFGARYYGQGSNNLQHRILLAEDIVDSVTIMHTRAPLRSMTIESLGRGSVAASPGNGSDPEVRFGYSPPTTGTYATGSVVRAVHVIGVDEQPLEWRCIAGGTPGTWTAITKDFSSGTLSAYDTFSGGTITSPRICTPGPGIASVVDTYNLMSISGDKWNIASGGATSMPDRRIHFGAVPWAAGRVIAFKHYRSTNATNHGRINCGAHFTASQTHNDCAGFVVNALGGDLQFRIHNGQSRFAGIITPHPGQDVDVSMAIVLATTGVFGLLDQGAGWKLVAIDAQTHADKIYPGWAVDSGGHALDAFVIRRPGFWLPTAILRDEFDTLSASWTQSQGTWTITTGTVHPTGTSPGGDGWLLTRDLATASPLLRVALPNAADIEHGILVNYVDPDNYYRIVVTATPSLALVKRSGGTNTTLSSTSITRGSNDVIHVCRRSSSTIDAYHINGDTGIASGRVGSSSCADFNTSTIHGLRANTSGGDTIDWFEAHAVDQPSFQPFPP